MRSLHVSHVTHATDNRPQAAEVQWGALARRLTRTPPIRHDLAPQGASKERLAALKRQLPAWLPARFSGKRCTANVLEINLLVLDYDDGADIAGERERWADYAHCMHTSWSHTPGHPKFRIVLPLARPSSPGEWGRVYEWAQRQTGRRVDRQAKNADRLFFLPALRSVSSAWESYIHEGDWLHLPPHLPPTKEERELAWRRGQREGRALLGRLQPTTRDRVKDPAHRQRIAHELGARIYRRASGDIAKGITCPGCGRKSVWFAIEPRRAFGAQCDHQGSCGWTGPITKL